MTSLLFLTLAACGLQSAPDIDPDQLSQWIYDAVMETVTHAKAENSDRALEAWRSAQLHFDSKMEPALRYYTEEQRDVTALEYRLGRIRDAITAGEYSAGNHLPIPFSPTSRRWPEHSPKTRGSTDALTSTRALASTDSVNERLMSLSDDRSSV